MGINGRNQNNDSIWQPPHLFVPSNILKLGRASRPSWLYGSNVSYHHNFATNLWDA